MGDMNETGTSIASGETTPSEISNTGIEAVEDGTTEIGNESGERSNDSLDVKIDLNTLPPEARKYAEKVEKEFKAAYTRKTQELASRSKLTDYEKEQSKQEVLRYQNLVKEILSDPSKVEAYRQVYGFQKEEQPPQKFETVEDLLAYQEQRIASLERNLEQKFERKLHENLNHVETVNRWDTAIEKIKASDPKFAKYEQIIVKMLDSPEYKKMYRPGMEEAVLRKSYENFKALLKDELEEVKKTVTDSYSMKKQATTLVPKKSVTTTAQEPATDKDAIIARVRARLGA